MAKPGVMFYFDLRKPLEGLSREDQLAVFQAILDYGQYGVLPDWDGVLDIVWRFIQPRLDADNERYERMVERRSKAAKAKWDKMQEQQMQQVQPTQHKNNAVSDAAQPSAKASETAKEKEKLQHKEKEKPSPAAPFEEEPQETAGPRRVPPESAKIITGCLKLAEDFFERNKDQPYQPREPAWKRPAP